MRLVITILILIAAVASQRVYSAEPPAKSAIELRKQLASFQNGNLTLDEIPDVTLLHDPLSIGSTTLRFLVKDGEELYLGEEQLPGEGQYKVVHIKPSVQQIVMAKTLKELGDAIIGKSGISVWKLFPDWSGVPGILDKKAPFELELRLATVSENALNLLKVKFFTIPSASNPIERSVTNINVEFRAMDVETLTFRPIKVPQPVLPK
jgi:hypothetical protein